jgi:hypothetical protein
MSDGKAVKEGIRSIQRLLAQIRREFSPDELCTSDLMEGFKTVIERLTKLRLGYDHVRQTLVKMEPCYPDTQRGNVQGKIKTVDGAIDTLDKLVSQIEDAKTSLLVLPVTLFSPKKEGV